MNINVKEKGNNPGECKDMRNIILVFNRKASTPTEDNANEDLGSFLNKSNQQDSVKRLFQIELKKIFFYAGGS